MDREHVNDSKHRFDIVLKFLTEDIIEHIRDVLREATRLADPYNTLKAELVRVFSPNVLEQLNGIVFAPELGGQPPSQLMTKMLACLPAGEPAGLLFKHHFVLRLPSDIRDMVAKKMEKMDAKKLAEYADTRWHVRKSRPPPSTTVAAIDKQDVEELAEAIAALPTSGGKQNHRKKPSKQGRGGKPAVKAWLCYNHNRYGKEAWSCSDDKKCSYQGNSAAGGQ